MSTTFNFLDLIAHSAGGISQEDINKLGPGDAVKIDGQLHEIVDVDKDDNDDVTSLFVCGNNCVLIIPLDEDTELDSVYYNSTNLSN